MKIKYLAHSSFLITSDAGTRVLLDPYEVTERLQYGPIAEPADAVVASHGHGDHAYTAGIPGSPTVIMGLELAKSGPRTVKGVSLRAVHTFHDPNGGQQRGENAVVVVEADGIRVCHCGDLGHTLGPDKVKEIGEVDVLLLPVGGHFTVDASEATRVMEALKPHITVPMHYKMGRIGFPIAPVDDFLAGKPNVRRPSSSDLDLPSRQALPAQPEVVVLEPSL